jgi:hypothetical protein
VHFVGGTAPDWARAGAAFFAEADWGSSDVEVLKIDLVVLRGTR